LNSFEHLDIQQKEKKERKKQSISQSINQFNQSIRRKPEQKGHTKVDEIHERSVESTNKLQIACQNLVGAINVFNTKIS
jgi:hypothetical protein